MFLVALLSLRQHAIRGHKKLGKMAGIGRGSGLINRHRGIGWEYLHVAADDAAHLAYTEIVPGRAQGPARSPSSRGRLPRSRATASWSSGS
jgi:hypothetical protein